MKAVVFEKTNHFTVKDVPVPEPLKNQVLIKVKACGICGTDIHLLHGVYKGEFPLIPGHEASGEVIKTGPDVKFLKTGDRIAVDPNVQCGYCEFCQRGRIHLCKNLRPFGVCRSGAFAEYAVIEETHAHKILPGMSWEAAAMVEPAACCIRGGQMGRIKQGDTVFIHGAGAVGNMNMQIARMCGATAIAISDPLPKRRELAMKMGADIALDPADKNFDEKYRDFSPDGADVILECTGIPELTSKSVMMVKKGGIVVIFGCPPIGKFIKISPEYINVNEITLCGSHINPFTHAPAIDMIGSGRLRVTELITHKFPLENFGEAVGLFGKPDTLKIIMTP